MSWARRTFSEKSTPAPGNRERSTTKDGAEGVAVNGTPDAERGNGQADPPAVFREFFVPGR